VENCLDLLGSSASLGHVRWLEVKGTLGASFLYLGLHQKLEDEKWVFNDVPQHAIDEILCEEEYDNMMSDNPIPHSRRDLGAARAACSGIATPERSNIQLL
jgi:hypothetical protein